MNASINKQRNYSLAIPLKDEEIERLDVYTRQRGLKKGYFVRKAIINELNRQDRAEQVGQT